MERDAEPQAAILDAAEELLRTRPFHDLAVAEVLSAAGVSRATFYNYFPSKVAVLVALAERAHARLIHAVAPWLTYENDDGEAGLRESLTALTALWPEVAPIVGAVLENAHAAPELSVLEAQQTQTLIDAVCRAVERERAAGRAVSDPDPHLLAAVLVRGTRHALYVAGRGLHLDLPDVPAATRPLMALWTGAIYGRPSTLPAEEARVEGAILAAAERLLAERSLHEIKVTDLIEAAGTNRARFYRTFSSKQAVAAALLRDPFIGAYPAIGGGAALGRDELASLIAGWLERIAVHGRLMLVAMDEWPRFPEFAARYRLSASRLSGFLAIVIDAERARGAAPAGADAGPLAVVMTSVLERCVHGYLAHAEGFTDASAIGDVLAAIYGRTIYQT